MVYGLHAIGAVIERAPERLLELWIAAPRDDARARRLRERAEAAGVRVQTAGSEALAKLAGDVAHQGVVAAVRPLKPLTEQDLPSALSKFDDPLLLVLDGVTDPHNLGACLRTADAAGVHMVIIPRDRAAAVDGVVRKVAAGAAEFMPVASVTNLVRTFAVLKEHGIWVVGTDADAERDPVRGRFEAAACAGIGGGGRRHAALDARALRFPGADPHGRAPRIPQRVGGRRRRPVRGQAPTRGLTAVP